ncbi:hypothetical protein SK128_000728 [Halocaridina rubra]|uniref:G-patch domain-containing protein n=1 Tax=Halocaridina rubra TaxID=373956 RepID=A0AAN8XKT4_HALRR
MENQPHPHWKATASAHLKWKQFVRASDKEVNSSEDVNYSFTSSLTGEEAMRLYKDIVKEGGAEYSSNQEQSSNSQENLDASPSMCAERDNITVEPVLRHNARDMYKAMKYAQNNSTAALSKMLMNGFSVNAKDEHGWSLLMVAACAGSVDVVNLLLRNKAKTGIRDAKGNTAIYLATLKGHTNIVEAIISAQKNKFSSLSIESSLPITLEERFEEFFCNICNQTVKESTKIQHETSIIHQFNVGSSSNKTVYGISPSNKGYQLLVNQGWDTEQGLGLESSGSKFPVKTILKQNREGFGRPSSEKAKITHFGPGDENAIKGCSSKRIVRQKILNRRELNRQRVKDRKKELMAQLACVELEGN